MKEAELRDPEHAYQLGISDGTEDALLRLRYIEPANLKMYALGYLAGVARRKSTEDGA